MPYLAKFENDWATAQIITQYFMNRRSYAVTHLKSVVVSRDATGRRVLKEKGRKIGKAKNTHSPIDSTEDEAEDDPQTEDEAEDEDEELLGLLLAHHSLQDRLIPQCHGP